MSGFQGGYFLGNVLLAPPESQSRTLLLTSERLRQPERTPVAFDAAPTEFDRYQLPGNVRRAYAASSVPDYCKFAVTACELPMRFTSVNVTETIPFRFPGW